MKTARCSLCAITSEQIVAYYLCSNLQGPLDRTKFIFAIPFHSNSQLVWAKRRETIKPNVQSPPAIANSLQPEQHQLHFSGVQDTHTEWIACCSMYYSSLGAHSLAARARKST
jgi:hypothetical protein